MWRVPLIIAAALCLIAAFWLGGNMPKEYTLRQYNGVGSGVFKHGTIVKVVNDKPVVIGHFDDESGKTVAGTVELVK